MKLNYTLIVLIGILVFSLMLFFKEGLSCSGFPVYTPSSDNNPIAKLYEDYIDDSFYSKSENNIIIYYNIIHFTPKMLCFKLKEYCRSYCGEMGYNNSELLGDYEELINKGISFRHSNSCYCGGIPKNFY